MPKQFCLELQYVYYQPRHSIDGSRLQAFERIRTIEVVGIEWWLLSRFSKKVSTQNGGFIRASPKTFYWKRKTGFYEKWQELVFFTKKLNE